VPFGAPSRATVVPPFASRYFWKLSAMPFPKVSVLSMM
jgi:hypothetical protein